MSTLPVSGSVMVSEMKGVVSILEKWITEVESGLPGIDVPGSEENLEDKMRTLCGELMVCSGKCETLVAAITGE